MKRTQTHYKQVTMYEYFTEEPDGIYWHWRINGGEWQKQLTAFTIMPWVEFDKDL